MRRGKLNNTWTQTVQRELETYSSDSEAYGGGKDIFYMAEGKGKGVWGLRNLNEGTRVFGTIEGTEVGQIFKDRKALGESGIHTPTMGGIWGSNDGASSIVLSGGYEADIDDWNIQIISYINGVFNRKGISYVGIFLVGLAILQVCVSAEMKKIIGLKFLYISLVFVVVAKI